MSPPQGSRWTLQATTMDGDFVSVLSVAFLSQLVNANYRKDCFLNEILTVSLLFFTSTGTSCNPARSDAGKTLVLLC